MQVYKSYNCDLKKTPKFNCLFIVFLIVYTILSFSSVCFLLSALTPDHAIIWKRLLMNLSTGEKLQQLKIAAINVSPVKRKSVWICHNRTSKEQFYISNMLESYTNTMLKISLKANKLSGIRAATGSSLTMIVLSKFFLAIIWSHPFILSPILAFFCFKGIFRCGWKRISLRQWSPFRSGAISFEFSWK